MQGANCSHSPAMARICNAADRPKTGCATVARHEGNSQAGRAQADEHSPTCVRLARPGSPLDVQAGLVRCLHRGQAPPRISCPGTMTGWPTDQPASFRGERRNSPDSTGYLSSPAIWLSAKRYSALTNTFNSNRVQVQPSPSPMPPEATYPLATGRCVPPTRTARLVHLPTAPCAPAPPIAPGPRRRAGSGCPPAAPSCWQSCKRRRQ